MCNVKISLDRESFLSKPTEQDTARISRRIGNHIKLLDLDEIKTIAMDISLDGYTFCPATFKNSIRNKENFEQQQLFALDFDNKEPKKTISFEEVKQRADYYDIPILFAYDTFTSKNHDKFRAVFLNDNSITDIRAAELMLKALTSIFPEADPQSKSPVQMYYGGQGLIYFDDSLRTINVESLLRNFTHCLRDRHGATNYKRNLIQFAKETGVSLNNKNQLDISVVSTTAEEINAKRNDKNLPNSSMYIPFGRKLSLKYLKIDLGGSSTNNLCENKKIHYHKLYRSSDLKAIRTNCELFQDFEMGKQRLHHDELFGIATNLVHVETGTTKFMECLHRHGYYDDGRNQRYLKWERDLKSIKNYKPYACNGFCPYKDKCQHGENILSTAKPRLHKMEPLANYVEQFVSIQEAEEDFEHSLSNAVQADAPGWYVLKAQTSLGKTATYLSLLKETDSHILIAVPTNKLKREIYERAANMGIQMTVSPSLHEIKDELSDELWDDIEEYLNSGQSAISYIKKKIAEDDPECSKIFRQYLKELETFNNSAGHSITTHRRLLTMRNTEKYDFIIVDEDILFNSVIPYKTDVSISDLKKLKKRFNNDPLGKKAQKILKKIKNKEFFSLPTIDYKKHYIDKSLGINISALCSAKYFCYRKTDDKDDDLSQDCVSFMNPVMWCDNAKYIMVSATVDENICKYYFNNSLIKFHECAKAQNTGILHQINSRSMSRTDIKTDPNVIERIKKWSGFDHTISFKMFANYYHDDLYFGNCAGCDFLKGKDIDVIGTPHQPEWIYKLFATSLDMDINVDEKIKPGTLVCHNGYRFRFTTYDDEVLRNIQFYMIESELEQAVGRARLLRCDCIVNLFSNFPLKQARMIDNFSYEEN